MVPSIIEVDSGRFRLNIYSHFTDPDSYYFTKISKIFPFSLVRTSPSKYGMDDVQLDKVDVGGIYNLSISLFLFHLSKQQNNMQKHTGTKSPCKITTSESNLIKLDDLFKFKKNKMSSVFTSCHFSDTKNENQIRVISPFYDRSKCVSKGPCYCPYHRKKRSQLPTTYFRKNGHTKNKDSQDDKPSYRKAITEQNQLKKLRSNQFVRQNCLKSTKLIAGTEKQNYNAVTHKVECRNSEFQYFLKKNQLYILTGKLSNFKNAQQISQLEAFLESLSKNGESHEELLNQDNGNNNVINVQGRKLGKKNGLCKQFGEDGLISKIRKLVQSVLNGSKNMTILQLEKLRTIFSRLLEQQRLFEGETPAYFKNKECLKNFDEFIQNQLGSTEKVQKTDNINQRKNENRKKSSSRGSKRQSIEHKKAGRSGNTINMKQGQIHRNSLFYRTPDEYEVNQKTEENSNKANESRFKQITKQQIPHKNQKILIQKSENSTQIQKGQKQIPNQIRNRKNYLHKANNENLFRTTYLKQQQNSQQLSDMNDLRNDQNLQYPYNSNNKKNQKQAKLEQIMNQIKQQTKIDENYLKMKKYIERNRRFIRKMEIKLNQLNLGVFIIDPTDSLITRKKKIRCLKELVSNQGQEKKGFYDEIIKYLDIYTEHCNMLLKREFKKNEEQMYFQYLEEQLIEILTSKDFTKSLKFINLHQNQDFEKESKLEWWINIPQYVTTDFTRQKRYSGFEHSVQIVQKQTKQKPTEIPEISNDQLVQKDLDNKCTIKIFHQHHDIQKDIKKVEFRKNQKNSCKFEKIWQKYGCSPQIC